MCIGRRSKFGISETGTGMLAMHCIYSLPDVSGAESSCLRRKSASSCSVIQCCEAYTLECVTSQAVV